MFLVGGSGGSGGSRWFLFILHRVSRSGKRGARSTWYLVYVCLVETGFFSFLWRVPRNRGTLET